MRLDVINATINKISTICKHCIHYTCNLKICFCDIERFCGNARIIIIGAIYGLFSIYDIDTAYQNGIISRIFDHCAAGCIFISDLERNNISVVHRDRLYGIKIRKLLSGINKRPFRFIPCDRIDAIRRYRKNAVRNRIIF